MKIMTEEERQKIREELPAWTEEFVQREWYKEFLQHYPLGEYPSLLEINPKVTIKAHNYEEKYRLEELLGKDRKFFEDLREEMLDLFYNSFVKVIIEINDKYNNKVFEDLHHLTLCTNWFMRNKDMVIELDKKYNNNPTN